MTAPTTANLPVTEVDGHPIDQAVRHQQSNLPELPNSTIYGVRRSSDHAGAWVFIEHETNRVLHVAPWSCRGGHLPATARRQRVRSHSAHYGACPYCGRDELRLVRHADGGMVLPQHHTP